jgi:hypothetical protein
MRSEAVLKTGPWSHKILEMVEGPAVVWLMEVKHDALVALVFAISPGPMKVGYSRAKFIRCEEKQ